MQHVLEKDMRFILGCIVCLQAFSFSAIADQPGFDCDKAHTETEKTICDTDILGFLDARMSKEYRKLISLINPAAQSRQLNAQRVWLNNREVKCKGNIDCIGNWTRSRELFLSGKIEQLRDPQFQIDLWAPSDAKADAICKKALKVANAGHLKDHALEEHKNQNNEEPFYRVTPVRKKNGETRNFITIISGGSCSGYRFCDIRKAQRLNWHNSLSEHILDCTDIEDYFSTGENGYLEGYENEDLNYFSDGIMLNIDGDAVVVHPTTHEGWSGKLITWFEKENARPVCTFEPTIPTKYKQSSKNIHDVCKAFVENKVRILPWVTSKYDRPFLSSEDRVRSMKFEKSYHIYGDEMERQSIYPSGKMFVESDIDNDGRMEKIGIISASESRGCGFNQNYIVFIKENNSRKQSDSVTNFISNIDWLNFGWTRNNEQYHKIDNIFNPLEYDGKYYMFAHRRGEELPGIYSITYDRNSSEPKLHKWCEIIPQLKIDKTYHHK
ncbi:MAG: DUF1311 domain-containing protein [Alphaproteobacteria bacterium]|nr:DUF1311 domain-containing protein [Alphaproteobacteria bacterium]